MEIVKKNITRRKGFSIAEVLVAGTFIIVAIVGSFSLLGPAIRNASFTNDMLVASMLAKEGIELVTNIRDTNWYEDFNAPPFDNPADAWMDGLGHISNQPDRSMGIIDYNDGSVITYVEDIDISSCAPVNNPDDFLNCQDTMLYLDANNFYSHNKLGGKPTEFRRMVRVEREHIGGGKYRLLVTSIVRWGDYSTNKKEVRLTNYLYNWMTME